MGLVCRSSLLVYRQHEADGGVGLVFHRHQESGEPWHLPPRVGRSHAMALRPCDVYVVFLIVNHHAYLCVAFRHDYELFSPGALALERDLSVWS